MTRWMEFEPGKLVDLDDVKGVEFLGIGDVRGHALLTVPGGQIHVHLQYQCQTDWMNRPTFTARRPGDRPWFGKKRRARWDQARAEYDELYAFEQRQYQMWESARQAGDQRAARAAFDQLVCTIGARDCGEDTDG